MSFSTIGVAGAKEDSIIEIPASDDKAGTAGPTVEANLTGVSGTSTGNIIYWIEVDCRNNPVEDVTFRLYTGTSNPNVGTDKAEVFVPGKRGRLLTYHWPAGITWPTTNKVYAACIKGAGGTAGSSAPSGQVKVRIGLLIGTDS